MTRFAAIAAFTGCAFSILAFATCDAIAQQYPVKPVRVIVPFAAGGGSDFVARLISQKLSEVLGQQVIVDNRPAGGASVGTEAALRSPSDGYTLLQITPTYTVNPSVRPVKYDITADYTPIVMEGKGPLVLLSHPSLPVKNLKELIALAKARPGSINYGSSGEGTLIHLATELITHMAQVKMVHIPYKGGGPALIDLIAGQIQLVLSPPQTGMAYARAGRLRALGMTTAERAQSDPDVPTIAESGVRGYEATNWHALIGPKGLPRPVVERLNGEIRRIIATPEVKSVFLANGIEPDGSTPDQLAALIRKDYEQWRVVVKATNLKVDS